VFLALGGAARGGMAQDGTERHTWQIGADFSYVAPATDLRAWTDGRLGKLRFDESDQGITIGRAFAEYRGRIGDTVEGTVIADYVDDVSGGLDLTEAFITWRPVPESAGRFQLRAGAFYPPLSLENGGPAWSSEYSVAPSAINTWLGEEIRPIGAEGTWRRRIGPPASPHQLGLFASAFYGNDPAGTLLFWRGWSLHDRQTRLNDRLPMPPLPSFGRGGVITGLNPHWLDPISEIDNRPGYYGGAEWRYRRKILLQLARYDNRADPLAFSGGQWGWRTDFSQLAGQVEISARIGLITQLMRGSTSWLIGAGADGTITPFTELREDEFEAGFVLLTGTIRPAHRLSLRYDAFSVTRNEAPPALNIDDGSAWTVSYQFSPERTRLRLGVEWIEIRSRRDLWTDFYAATNDAETESQLRLQLSATLGH